MNGNSVNNIKYKNEISMTFLQPLSVYFVWHPSDHEKLIDKIDYCANSLNRDSEKPYSRSINIPTFYKTSHIPNVPSDIPDYSQQTLIFIFVSKYIVTDDNWNEYIQNLSQNKKFKVLPIAVDEFAFNLKGNLSSKNFIRAFEFDINFYKENLLLTISHEIYRLALNNQFNALDLGSSSAIKLFLSHAKDNGVGVALTTRLKSFIENTSLNHFFDATDIAPGYEFDQEISGNLKNATLIAIHSDTYSSRYWCQKEIQYAKEFSRPIIAADCLSDYEDRRFPLASNIPSVRVPSAFGVIDLYKIVTYAILETIRYFYTDLLLNQYKKNSWFPSDAIILSRPPEITDLLKCKDLLSTDVKKKYTLIYPEPPVYEEELLALKSLGIKISTPLNATFKSSKGLKVGISISAPDDNELLNIGLRPTHLQYLAQDIGRHILAQNNTLIYGGDLRKGGFTEFLITEAQALQSKMSSKEVFLKNYLSWPLYLADEEEVINWKAKYCSSLDMINIPYDEKIKSLIPNDTSFLPPTTADNVYIWSKCLTKMRNESILDSNVRICAGGKHSKYKGKMPGVLEEILIALKLEKPIYLLGGFGGICKSVIELIETKSLPEKLTEIWQKENTPGYSELLDKIRDIEPVYYPEYVRLVDEITIDKLNNGLDENENKALFNTPFIDEAIHLIFLGLARIKIQQK